MKTSRFFLAAAFSFLLSVSSFAGNKNKTNNTGLPDQEGQIAVTSVIDGKIDVTIKKSEGKNMLIRLVDENGKTLARVTVKNDEDTRTRFDLSNLTDGDYEVVITNGTNKIIRPIVLDTHEQRIVNMG